MFDINEKHMPNSIGNVQNLSKFINPEEPRSDFTIALEVFEHVLNPREVIFECFNVLNDNGILIFSIPWITRIHDRPHD